MDGKCSRGGLALLCPVVVLLIGCSGAEWRATVASPVRGPAISLPVVASENVAIDGFPSDAEVPNDLRAWHYSPKMVPLLVDLHGTVADQSRLSKGMMRKMVVIVASRNGCRY